MDAYDHAADLVRLRDRDRYIADLFIPAPVRRHVLAIHAFDAEIAHIRDAVSEPVLGEIRQEWWREALAGSGQGQGHPVAEALLETIAAFRLPQAPFRALIDARTFDLYNDPMPTLGDFEGYAGETSSALIQLAALVLGEGRDLGAAEAAGHAGVALSLTALMRRLPRDARRRQLFLPLDRLMAAGVVLDDLHAGKATPALVAALGELRGLARDHNRRALDAARALPAAVRPAFLPLALVEPDLRRLERRAADPLTPPPEMPSWRRQWVLWRAARR